MSLPEVFVQEPEWSFNTKLEQAIVQKKIVISQVHTWAQLIQSVNKHIKFEITVQTLFTYL